MAEPSDDDKRIGLPNATAPIPSKYQSTRAKERFAVSKFYGMGPDGEWTVAEIADELDVSKRQVYRYLYESEIGEETREVLATTQAEWRLDMAIQLRREVKRLEEIEEELLQQQQAVPTGYESKTVKGTPTGDRNISLSDHSNEYRLEIPVPTDFETVTDYGPDLERVQKEKRNYLQQISKLLGLDAAKKQDIDRTLTQRHEEVKIVEFRDSDDDYPEQDVIDVDGSTVETEMNDDEGAQNDADDASDDIETHE